jgi:hypothetical protein
MNNSAPQGSALQGSTQCRADPPPPALPQSCGLPAQHHAARSLKSCGVSGGQEGRRPSTDTLWPSSPAGVPAGAVAMWLVVCV